MKENKEKELLLIPEGEDERKKNLPFTIISEEDMFVKAINEQDINPTDVSKKKSSSTSS